MEEPIYKAYPKVKPLALTLIAAAAERGAAAEEFELACQMVRARLEKRASGILLSELQKEEVGCFGHVLRCAAAKIAAAKTTAVTRKVMKTFLVKPATKNPIKQQPATNSA